MADQLGLEPDYIMDILGFWTWTHLI
jgi:hypothetical protein